MSHLRVEIAQMAHNTRAFFVADDGSETEISSIVTGVDIHAKVGNASTATLDVIKVAGHATAELADVVVTTLNPPSWWHRRLRDITTFGHRARRYAT